MQLLRAARAACTKPHLRVISIGSSFSLGPIFLPLRPLGENPVLSQLQRFPSQRPLIEIV